MCARIALALVFFTLPLAPFLRAQSTPVRTFRVLYVPMTFLDQNAAPASEATSHEVMATVAEFYARQSFGKLSVQTIVAPPVRLPRTEAYYIAKDLEVDGLSLEHSDAMAEVSRLGFDPAGYDCRVLRLNGGPRTSGGWSSSGRVWIYHDDAGIVAHEMGHALGFAHANAWNTGGVSTIGGGAAQEYGDPWDVMGVGGVPNGHCNIWAKFFAGWLPAAQIWDAKGSGTYRIFAHDAGSLNPARHYGLKVAKDSARTYYIEARQLRDNDADQVWLKHGALLAWRWPAKAGNHLLLDTTPGSRFGKDDGGLVLGRTFSDREAGLHFTPVAVNFGAQKSVDLVVNVGAFPGNHAPALALTTTPGAVTTIDATATDPDGDALAYFWETDDRQVYANSAQFTRTFTSPGMYRVSCTVSDMKGGATMRYVIVNVGAHAQFSIGGRVTIDGAGMPGVLVKTSTHQASTDADGFYTIAGLDAGTQTITVVREGFVFTGTTDFNIAANVGNADFAATAGTFLTISTPLPGAAEGGAPGRFVLTRTGNLGNPLAVKMQPISGTATKAADYLLTPDVAANTFAIPAGQSSLEIHLAPVDDANVEGPETATLQLVPDPAYVIEGVGEGTITIQDNDTILPLVSIVATRAHTVEKDPAPAHFTVTRTGSTAAPLAINFTIAGTATNGADYAALASSIIIPAGQASVDIEIATLDDELNEGSENVTLTLANDAAYLTAPSSTTATIADDDQPFITITAADPNAAEIASGAPNPGVFVITRSGDPSQPLTVFYALAGTAIHGVDFETLPGTVTIPPGKMSAAVTVRAIADGIGEGDETAMLLLTSSGTGYQIAGASIASVMIADDVADPANIEVFVNDGFTKEGVGAGSFRLTARGGNGAAIPVNFTMSGTATEGADYSTLSGSVTIPAGTGAHTVDVVIAPIQDTLAEPVETVTINLANGRSATMWLRDGDAPTVFVDVQRDVPAEGGVIGGFYLSREGATNGPLDVHFTLTGSATNGADYAEIPLTATIPASAHGVDVIVMPTDDALAEGTETIILTLASGGYSASPVPAVLYLTDNETPAPVVQFANANGAGREDAGLMNVPVLLAGTIAAPVTIEYFIGSGPGANSALGSGVDYVLGGGPVGTLTFFPGNTTQSIPFTIIDDAAREPGERLTIRLRHANGAVIGASAEFIFSIEDNDGEDSPLAADDADPDFDGIVNLLEAAQNLDPNAPDSGPVFGRDAGFLTLTYRRNLAEVVMTWAVEETLNLADADSWSPASVIEEIVSDDGMTRVIKAKVSTAGDAGHFLRLRVTRD